MKTTRKYTMGARAAAVEETRRRILDSVIGLAAERRLTEITLEAVAERAGVSVQTVLRQFGSRDGLLAQAVQAGAAAVEEERRTPRGDVPGAVRTVVDHYERRGRAALLMLAQEQDDDVARQVTDQGKAMHRDWVRASLLPDRADEALLDLLVVATDVYAWKLLRLDRGLSRAATERRMHTLVDAVLSSATAQIGEH